jgi:hypothetical protein
MATLGSKLITKEQQWMANMTEQNHLGKSLMIKPQLLQGTMNQLFSSKNYYSDNPIQAMLLNVPHGTQTLTETSWEWEMRGADRRPLVVVEEFDTTLTKPGLGTTTFSIVLDENWYLPGDVIYHGTSDKSIQVRIQDEVMKYGNGWKYTVRGMWDDQSKFLNPIYLKPGQQWTKLYSVYEEAAEQSGSTQFSLPIGFRNSISRFRNSMSRFRKEYRITDLASTSVLAVRMLGSDGKHYDTWVRYAEVEFWKQWYREVENGFWYTNSTKTVMGANGRPTRSGPGIQEMIKDGGHIHRYSHLTATLIEEYLMDVFYGRVKPGKGRHIKAFTGEYGMLMFHKAIERQIGQSGFIKNFADHALSKKSTDLNKNTLEFGYQFQVYHMANGCTLELIHNPLYDDRNLHFEIDPVTGYPVESMRFTFLDFAPGDSGGSNVKIMEKKDGFAFAYIQGLYGPYGPSKRGDTVAHAGSYYEMHVQKDQGIHIEDPTRCGELILSRN